MKNCLLCIASILLMSSLGYGNGDSNTDYFNEYVNSPEGHSAFQVNNNINAHPAINSEHRDNRDKADGSRALQGIPAGWKSCSIDSDCTAGVVDCMSWEALNKKYLHRLYAGLNSCSASIDPGFQPQTVCQAKACKSTSKDTDVSWEDWLVDMHKDK